MDIDQDDEKTKAILNHVQGRMPELQDMRKDHEQMWQSIGEYICPRRDFSLRQSPGAIRRRTLVDTTAVTACSNMADTLFGFMINPYEPWLRPNLEDRAPTRREAQWFDHVEGKMFRFLNGPRATFRAHAAESLHDDCAFANSVLWSGKQKASGRPFFRALPLQENFWAENEEGVVDTNYRRFTRTLRQAYREYPTPKIAEKYEKTKADHSELIDYIHAVEPREDGVAGAISENKPVGSYVVCETTNEVAVISGFDSFPYAITRMSRRTGDVYGIGRGWVALPLAILVNAMVESLQRRSEMDNDPPILDVAGVLSRLDRRPGAVNRLNAADLGLIDPKDIIQTIAPNGSVSVTPQLIEDTRAMIREVFYSDWLSLGSGQYVTAEFTADKRDLRLRSMSPITSRIEQEKLTVSGDRAFELMQGAGMFDKAPESLDGEDFTFDYTSPMAIAQKAGEAERLDAWLDRIERASVIDEDAQDVADVPMILTDALKARGAGTKYLRSEADRKARRDQRTQARQQAEQIEAAEGAARAGRDGAQALASLDAAPGGPQ